MIDGFRCDDKETLISFVYGEVDADVRRRVDAHLLTCAGCQGEIAGFAVIREELASWAPPGAELELTPVRKPVPKPAPTRQVSPWSGGTLSAWGGMAAAVLILATGAAMANVQVRFADGALTVSTGWTGASAPGGAGTTAGAPADTPGVASDPSWREALSQVEAELRAEIHAQRTAPPPAPSAVLGPTQDGALLRRVQSLISESEQRQREELALRLTQFNRDLEVQRRTDLVRIEQGFGQVEGRAGAEAARQRQLLNYLVRVSGQPQQ